MADGPTDARQLLGPEFAPLLEMDPFGHLDETTLADARQSPPGLGSTEGVVRTDHWVPGAPALRIRTHRPRHMAGPLPGVYSIHGGGLVLGTIDLDDPRFEIWCPALGVMGVSIDYRLAPETPYPGPLEDCYRGLSWTYQNAESIGLDQSRLGVYGVSAGGGLAAGLALLARDRGELTLAFQLLECPMLDDRLMTPSSNLDRLAVWSRAANHFGWRSYLGDRCGGPDVPPYAAPARASDLSGLPPAFISVGGADGFRDEDVDYALRLSQAGVPAELHVYPGAPHGYPLVPDSAAALQGARDRDDWLARALL